MVEQAPGKLVTVTGVSGFLGSQLCVLLLKSGYRVRGTVRSLKNAAKVEPVYETMPGWQESTVGARSWADLPAEAVKYVRRIEELIDTPVALVSTSPEREDVILMRDPYRDE